MEVAVDVVVFMLGAAAALATLGSAVRTVVLPRGVPAKLGSLVFVVVGRLFRLRAGTAVSRHHSRFRLIPSWKVMCYRIGARELRQHASRYLARVAN